MNLLDTLTAIRGYLSTTTGVPLANISADPRVPKPATIGPDAVEWIRITEIGPPDRPVYPSTLGRPVGSFDVTLDREFEVEFFAPSETRVDAMARAARAHAWLRWGPAVALDESGVGLIEWGPPKNPAAFLSSGYEPRRLSTVQVQTCERITTPDDRPDITSAKATVTLVTQ